MRTLPPGLQAHLDSGATTLCWCWRVERRDGEVLGFTDHDRDLTFADTVFLAATGFTTSEQQSAAGLNVDNLEVSGVLAAESLTEADLAAGHYDDARISLYRVNWAEPAQHVLIQEGTIGEVRRGDNIFSAEVRGLAHYLQQERGRIFQYGCDAQLGDGSCRVDLSNPMFRAEGRVKDLLDNHIHVLRVEELGEFASDWFSGGRLTWTRGANAPGEAEVKRHSTAINGVFIELWGTPAFSVRSGDRFRIIAGCDKQFSTCGAKFANKANFRGFPHMPGNDFMISYPNSDDGNNDGSSRL